MKHQLNSKIRPNRSQQTTGNVIIAFPESNTRQSKTIDRFGPVTVQRINAGSRARQRYEDEFIVVDKDKAAATGKWILNVIADRETHKKTHIAKKNEWYTDTNRSSHKKKHSFQSRQSSKVEPIEVLPSKLTNQFVKTHKKDKKNQNMNQMLPEIILSPATIDDGQITHMSSFSTATSIDDDQTLDQSSISSQTKSYIQSRDCSTDEFKDSEERSFISKRKMIILTVISIIVVIGIIVAVVVTIFVGKNDSTSSSAKSLDSKSMLVSINTLDGSKCFTQMFSVTDPLCKGQAPYNYYSCYQMASSTSFTIQFSLQHDTISGHWYFDDVSAVQNGTDQRIVNGGFELNSTGWTFEIPSNSTPETYVDIITGLAHTGVGYLYGGSKDHPSYIEQTFTVTPGKYVNVSFWWGYDGGLNLGNTCEAIVQLIS